MKVVGLALAVLAASAAAAGTAHAAQCSTKELHGLWVGTAEEDDPAYCLFQFKKTGRLAQSSCFEGPVIKPSATATGRLTVAKDCTVTGAFVATGTRGGNKAELRFTGTLDPAKGIIQGTMKPKGGRALTYGFARHWR